MIVRCPSCSSRRDVPFAGDTGAALVDCTECGHDWIEGPPLPSPNLRSVGTVTGVTAPNELDVHPYLQAARGARKEFDQLRRVRRLRQAAWGSLALLGLAPMAALAAFPDDVAMILPGTIHLYEQVGTDVNIYGLEIRRVDVQRLIVEGRTVLAVKCEVLNDSPSDRKVPWLRFGLVGNDGSEVYHWVLDTEVRPLKPGESTTFVSRLASPPPAARNLQIRFARADEIGSNHDP